MTTARIRTAFETKISTWAAAQSPALTVAWENKLFSPPTGAYCRAFLIPGRTVSRDLGGVNRTYTGLFQVSLYMPTGTLSKPGADLADSLDTAFPVEDPLIVGDLAIFLTSPMSPAAAIEDAGRYVVPVSCTYTAVDYLD